jgi:hypothetical protein
MDWRFTFPGGHLKALTFSYDDGREHDRRLVEILNAHGLKGAFHLNSAKLDQAGHIRSSEVASLYKGHEISAHGATHIFLTHYSDDVVVGEILEDRRALERLAGYPVRGMSYAFGDYTPTQPKKLKALGIEYARTCASGNNFKIPPDFLEWGPTCHHNANLQELADSFLSQPEFMALSVFYVWGHSYEFENDGSWGAFEAFASRFDGVEDIWRATSIEICRYVGAARSLATSVDGRILQNVSGLPLWLKAGGELRRIEAGGELRL